MTPVETALKLIRGKVRVGPGECLSWKKTFKLNKYAVVFFERKNAALHRVMHELARGPIPKGYHVDHLCCNKSCVALWHLEAVTPTENIRRANAYTMGTLCRRGHKLTPKTVKCRRDRPTRKECRICYNAAHRLNQIVYMRRKKERKAV